MLNYSEEDLGVLSDVLVPVAVAEVDDKKGFRFLSLNAAHMEVSGLERDRVVGHPPSDLLPEVEANMVTRRYAKSASTGLPQTYDELLTLPGGRFWWRTSIAPIKDETGAVRRLCVSSIPVDQEVRLRNLAQNLVSDVVEVSSGQPMVDRAFRDSKFSLEAIRILAERIGQLEKDFSPDEQELIRYVGKLADEADRSLAELKRLSSDVPLDLFSQSLMSNGPISSLIETATDEDL